MNDDNATKAIIYDWFQYRTVCDDEKFPVFFRRLLNEEYPKYNELLRIQPGYGKYDWLVGNYLERETTNSSYESATGENTTTGTTSNTGTAKQTATTNAETNTDGIETLQKSGRETTATHIAQTETHAGDDVTKYGHNILTEYDTEDALTKAGEETILKSGNVGRHTDTTTTTRGQSISTTRSGSNGRDTYTNVGETTAQKTAPMDVGILAHQSPAAKTEEQPHGTAGNLVAGFDGHASAIAQRLNHTDTGESGHTSETETTTPGSGSDETATEYGSTSTTETEARSFNARTDTATKTGTDTQRNEGSDTLTHGHTIRIETGANGNRAETSYNDRKDTTTTDNKTTTEAQNVVSSEKSDNLTNETTGATSTTRQADQRQRERLTGRQKHPAEILKEATLFISKTDAWQFLKDKLEVCFICVYD